MNLKNKKAIVTGAGQGIGRSIALKMAEQGADIVIAEWNLDTGRQVAKEIEDKGGKVLFFPVDVAYKIQVRNMVRKVVRVWGRIDILINNAGFDRGAALLKVTEEDWDAVLGVHLKGTFNCIQAVSP